MSDTDLTKLFRLGEVVTIDGCRGRIVELSPTHMTMKPLWWRRVGLHLERIAWRLRSWWKVRHHESRKAAITRRLGL